MTAIAIYSLVLMISTIVIITVAFLLVHKIISWNAIKPNEALHNFFAERFSIALATNAEVGDVRKSFVSMLKSSRNLGVYRQKKKRMVARKVLRTMSSSVVGENKEWLLNVYESMGFADDAVRELKDRRWWKRADAIRELQIMRYKKAAGNLSRLLRDKHGEVKLLASEGLIEITGISSLAAIEKYLGNLSRWSAINLSRAILENKNGSADYLIHLFDHRDSSVRLFAIQLIGIVQAVKAVPRLLEIVEAGSSLEKIAGLQALGIIGDERAVPQCRLNLKSEVLGIRAMAAAVLGRFGDSDFIVDLAELLDDKALEVRIAAAEALSRCGKEGLSALQTVYLKGSHAAAAVAGFVQDEIDLDSIGASIMGDY